MLRLSLLLAALLAPASMLAQASAVPIDAIMGAPFPSSMTAAPSGGVVAWVQNDKGVRNIWVAAPPAYQARQITQYTTDDGQDIGGLTFTPDAATLFFVRGGGANRAGDSPNPTSDPAGAEQAIWRIAVAGGAPARVGAGSGVAVSPKGDQIVFGRRGQAYAAPVDGSKEPAQLLTVRTGAGSFAWSPDGSKLAFVSGRGDHAFVGVYDPDAKSVRWMAPSVDRDNSPVWSPDGRRLAFMRMPASSELNMFAPAREGRPWSIMVADVATGTTRTAWTADSGMGSVFRGIVTDDQLKWGAGDRIVFPWEKTGWTLLYSIPASGGAATLLTPGSFEVEYATMTPDNRHVVYNSNQGDMERRDLWRVAVGGGPPTAITKGDMIEWQPAVASDGATIVYLRSTATQPAHAMIRLANGQDRPLAPGTMPADYPDERLVQPTSVTITAADGMQIPAQLFLPPNLRPGDKRPAVIFFHGGSRRQMLLGFHYSGYYHGTYAMNQHMASKGYVVLAVNYRSGIGYGMKFREALNYGARGASEVYDVLGAGLYLRNRPDVDPAKIGLWGGSYGGFLTAQGLAQASELFAAGVDIHGVHDWNVGIRTFVPSYAPTDSLRRMAFNSSPMAYIDRWRSPVLVIHGDDDRNVSFTETVTLVEALRERGVEVEQLVFPDEIHGFLRHENWLAAYRATADFFDRKLRGSSGGRTAGQ
jgi:dipeptidyl aminopeptidase/acylaminoacyl peptidase